MSKTCLKCGHVTHETRPDCPSCGAIYARVAELVAAGKTVVRIKSPEELARLKRESEQREADARQRAEAAAQAVQEQARQAAAGLQAAIATGWETGRWDGVPRHVIEQEKQRIVMTTTADIPGRSVAKVLEIISAECAYGMNLMRDLFAGITDVVGGRSGSTQTVLRDARRRVMAELRDEAFSLGADAVIGVDLDYSEFSGGGKSMLFVVATGTAVKLTLVQKAQA